MKNTCAVLFILISTCSFSKNGLLNVDDSIYTHEETTLKLVTNTTKFMNTEDDQLNLFVCEHCSGNSFVVKANEVKLIRIFNEEGHIIMTSSYFPEEDNYFEFEQPGKYFIELLDMKGEFQIKEFEAIRGK